MKRKIQIVAINAMIACIYAVFTLVCSAFSYGAIQLRLSEILIFLAFYNRRYIPGLLVGCMLANAFSPLGIYDVIFGTLASLITCLSLTMISNLFLGAFLGALFNGIIVGAELYFLLDLPFFINAKYVFIGELIVLLIGVFVFKFLEKNPSLMQKYIMEDK